MMKRTQSSQKGTVFLVGAGPGDPRLITLKGAEVLATADVVIYDRLVSAELLDLNRHGEKIYVGKNTGVDHGAKADQEQNRINRLLVRYARQGRKVIRLKGGDPFIFGRGGEEAFYLAKHHIPFEVVPGITAGYAVPAYAGIPVTDRRYASQVVFVTGHEGSTKEKMAIDWNHLAKIRATIIFFMGMKNLKCVTERLIREGKPAHTQISVIEWGTLSRQRIVAGTLKTIVEKAKSQKISSPALIIVGDVNRLREKLAWFEKRPLFGKTVLVTRARAQARGLKKELEDLGAKVIEFPVIQIQPPAQFDSLDAAIQEVNRYDWILFTSPNGVRGFLGRMAQIKRDVRHLTHTKIAAIGDVTKETLVKYGIQPDLVPDQFTTQGLVEALGKKGEIDSRSFLLPRADIAPDALNRALKKRGATVYQVTAYRTILPTVIRMQTRNLRGSEKIDFILFTSSSTVENFFKLGGGRILHKHKPRLMTIGPVTSATLRRFGYRPYRQASQHTIRGLIQCLLKQKKSRGMR